MVDVEPAGAFGWERIPDLVPARMLNEFAYCPRLAFIEWVNGEFADNEFTVEGRYLHRRVDKKEDPLPDPSDPYFNVEEKIHARSVLLSSRALGAIARMDLVEAEGGIATPVDYKRTLRCEEDGSLAECDRVQLCLQGLILQDNGYESREGVIFHADVRRRSTVPFDEPLRLRTLSLLSELKRFASEGVMPPPLMDSPRCAGCSLAGICLPDEINLLASTSNGLRKSTTGDGRESGEVSGEKAPRRLVPARDDALPLYVTMQGARVGKHESTLKISERREGIQEEVRIIDVSHVGLFGNVQITTQAVQELCSRGIPITYHSRNGWFYGITTGMAHKNIALRQRQYAVASEPDASLSIARAFISGKILNSRTMLMRNHREPPDSDLRSLKELASRAEEASSTEELLGIEGNAARIYFAAFTGMLRPDQKDLHAFSFEERNRRPPKDPINALLSFTYSLLARDLTAKILSVGLDPYLGFFHRPRYGRPSLALDIMEEFRPLIADSVVITAVNTSVVKADDFIHSVGSANLTDAGRRRFIAAYARRMDQLVTHPVFKYRISYSRVLEVQARLLGKYLMGEIEAYPSFRTR